MAQPTEEQIRQWHGRLFRTALRMTGNVDLASDLTQQTFLKALENWGQFNGRSLPTTWLHRILVNCIRDWQRRQQVLRFEPLDEWALVSIESPSSNVDKQGDAQRRLARVRGAVDELPPELRSAFVATVIDGYTYEEAAQMLSQPVGTVGWRVHVARMRLRTVMQQDFAETENV